jgi:hypothetical protein
MRCNHRHIAVATLIALAAQKPIDVKKGIVVTTPSGARRRLAALNRTEGNRITRFLFNTWNAQGDDLRIEDIEFALSNGKFTPQVFSQWREEYINYVDNMGDAWRTSSAKSGSFVMDGLFKSAALREPLAFDSFSQGVNDWIQNRGALNITEFTRTQQDATRFLLNYFTTEVPLTVDEMGRILRGVTGLTGPQSQALANFGKGLQAQGFKGAKLAAKIKKRELEMIAARAKFIAREEIINAYNAGTREAYRQVAESALLSPELQGMIPVKIWDAAPRCCPTCCALHGEIARIDDVYSNGTEAPHAHPRCDCSEQTGLMSVEEFNEVAA